MLLISCGPDESKVDVITEAVNSDEVVVIPEDNLIVDMDSTAQFINFYRKFISAFLGDSESELDRYLHQEHGVHLIHSFSGAMPQVSQFKKSAHFDQDESVRDAIGSLQEEVVLEPLFEGLPTVVCDEVVYSKMGCFAEHTSNNLSQHPWNKGGYEKLINTVEITVVNTYLTTFYFSKIEGKWYVTFIDLRVPCSA